MSGARVSVAIQGEPGSNSALAAELLLGAQRVDLVPCHTFAELFSAVAAGTAAYGLSPVENSLGGSVHLVWEQLEQTPCRILGEHYFHVRHCLVAHPAVPLQEIRRIYSHEQALAQCRRFLRKLVWVDPDDIVPVYDTAGAVKMVRARGRREEAAIAAARAAEIYDMRVLATDIQTDPNNFTRFLLLGGPQATPVPGPGWGRALKSTLILTVDHCARALPAIAQVLQDAGLGLDKLETVKLVGQPWQYRVYVDVDATNAGAAWELDQVVPQLEQLTRTRRLVGTYPQAEVPASATPAQSSIT